MFPHHIRGIETSFLTEDGLTIDAKTISYAFENVLFGDLKYGLLGSVPAEMLHVSGTGLRKHMFGCLDNLIGGPNSKKKESFDDLHRRLVGMQSNKVRKTFHACQYKME